MNNITIDLDKMPPTALLHLRAALLDTVNEYEDWPEEDMHAIACEFDFLAEQVQKALIGTGALPD